ncbi:cytochrome P450 6B5-like [Cimex lectularius]|uniref:Cytochrome P450 n=1 Tax=Cimex lectularius TaxID=79782 RepID=A0A8I6TJN6_CIMLE|nr:cytochrome P450 6B5-like [Cimex lectularius]XP_024082419.1 cytochrome P450 6B5-like [Cimex lectularius]
MVAITCTLVVIVLSFFFYLYVCLKKTERYWRERNVGSLTVESIITVLLPILKNEPIHRGFYNFHKAYPNYKFIVMNIFRRPIILTRDAEFLQKIMIKDFQHFVDHSEYKTDRDIVNLGLFSLTGSEWRGLRIKMSPTFTTGKLKSMFVEMEPCSNALVQNIEKTCGKPDYDIRDDIMTYAMDVTASVIFGIELKNKELREKYIKEASELFQTSPIIMFIMGVASQIPVLSNVLNMKILDENKEAFFRNIITQTFEQRKANNSNRNDYINLLLKLKEQGSLEVKMKDPDDEYLNTDSLQVENVEVTDEMLTAQAFQFLSAGFEQIYNIMVLMLNEIARQEDIQEKIRKEIAKVKTKNGGYNYRSVREMVYLEQCVHETLRKYPVIPFLLRYCVKDYVVNDHLTIKKGTHVGASLEGIHKDPNYFPDPEKYDPDRFKPDEAFKNIAYLPFGAGPRVCIAMRFALMEMKLGLAKIIENFFISPGEKATYPLEMNNRSMFISPRHGYLKMSKIANMQQ